MASGDLGAVNVDARRQAIQQPLNRDRRQIVRQFNFVRFALIMKIN